MPWHTRLTTVRRAEGQTFLWRRKRHHPEIDPSFGDPRLKEIRAAATEGPTAWPAIRPHLAAAAQAPAQAPTPAPTPAPEHAPEDLTFLTEALQTAAGLERWIGEVIAAAPGDPLPLLASGARHIGWAWHARGGPDAPHVSEEQRNLFRARLATAEEHLSEAARLAPSWATPRYFLQISGRGLELGPETARHRFEETLRRAPGHAAAHREHLRQLAPKWGGSEEEMLAFAREAMLAAPGGSPLGELVALAHLEKWLALGADPLSAYLGGPAVLTALHDAAARSVYHPAFVRHRDWTLSFNTFAMAFSLAGDYAAARPLFRALGTRATETPWQYLDERSPLVPFFEWRTRVTH
ncbi:hypothetical protein OG552_12745 [Streptomyces sp. NBC_01476]|uniref:hypothetical protein n=1 Tax=Streptomyces sp. NBC_01476 TaxID=2903881 RepID=UPI002E2FB134|nr:hypothetical protein [Streptomyces sp. NBC_01476]